jgi:long-chain fatty acid transport protein
MANKKLLVVAAVAAALAPFGASATNGYFSHGYGMKSKGMAGVGVALPQDSLAAATNPAGMALIGDRLDVGLDWFQPKRSTTLAFPGAPFNGEYSGNGDSSFFIPEFGYNKMIRPDLSLGVSVYGNGGMNTNYTTLNAATGGMLFGQGDLGVDMSQLFVAPTLGYKINKENSVGVSMILAYQRFKAYGLTNFAAPPPFNASIYPANVTNNGYDGTFGVGFRIGWIGQVTPEVSLGASYQSPIWMQSIDKYKGLFANAGEFDIPMNATVGLAWKVMPKANLAFDIQWVNYGGITSINNTMYTPCQLGTSCGPGFAWRDMTTFKLGGDYDVTNDVKLRGGVSYGRQPIPSDQTFFNVIAPGVPEWHATLGATWTLPNKSELTVAYMHAFENEVTGSGGTAGFNLKMYQNSLGIAWGMKF